ncbi:MAG: hypothetical protein ACP5DC_06545 [Halothiobacillaceae bacterium]
MTRKILCAVCRLMRSALFYGFVALTGLLIAGVAQSADRALVSIDYENPPADLLPADEVDRIKALRDLVTWFQVSEPSPDGNALFVWYTNPSSGHDFDGFLALDGGADVPLNAPEDFMPLMSPRSYTWLDENHLGMLVTLDSSGDALGLARIDRRDGNVVLPETPLTVSGEFLALSPGGRYILSIAPLEEADAQQALPKVKRSRSFLVREDDELEIYTAPSRLLLFDRHTMSERELMTLPAGVMTPMFSFSSDDGRLALVLNYGGDFSRGEYSTEQILTREAMGLIPPGENPLHTLSELVTFDLEQPGLPPPAPESHQAF